jgi:hypothetical protein
MELRLDYYRIHTSVIKTSLRRKETTLRRQKLRCGVKTTLRRINDAAA